MSRADAAPFVGLALSHQAGKVTPYDGESNRRRVVPVMVPMPAERAYSYAVPEGMTVVPGSIVRVPLGPRQVAGIVWDGNGEAIDSKRLRPIEQVFDCPPVPDDMRRFVDWVADYTLSPPGLVARMVLRAPEAFDPEPPVAGIRLRAADEPPRMTPARLRVIDLAGDGLAWTRSGLAHAAGVSTGVVDGLISAGLFEPVEIPPRPVVALPDPGFGRTTLTADQTAAAETLRKTVAEGGFSATLIDGVTGSGKTEVYFEAIAAALQAGRQVLVLIPEIALTQAFLDRFHDRFGAKPAEWHSDLPPRMRERVWRQVAEGSLRVVVGARSSLFLPFSDLGLIVVDEEHDPAFKQEDRVFYNARDMAVKRASLGQFPIMLSSATPSVETQVNANQGRYRRVRLASRYAEAALPQIASVDLRRHPPARGNFLSPVLQTAVAETVQRGEQALLFLNRRGYAPLTRAASVGIGSNARTVPAGWWSIGFAASSSVTSAVTPRRSPKPARSAGRSTIWWLADPAWSGSARRSRQHSRRRGRSCFPRTCSAACDGCGWNWRRSPRAKPTS